MGLAACRLDLGLSLLLRTRRPGLRPSPRFQHALCSADITVSSLVFGSRVVPALAAFVRPHYRQVLFHGEALASGSPPCGRRRGTSGAPLAAAIIGRPRLVDRSRRDLSTSGLRPAALILIGADGIFGAERERAHYCYLERAVRWQSCLSPTPVPADRGATHLGGRLCRDRVTPRLSQHQSRFRRLHNRWEALPRALLIGVAIPGADAAYLHLATFAWAKSYVVDLNPMCWRAAGYPVTGSPLPMIAMFALGVTVLVCLLFAPRFVSRSLRSMLRARRDRCLDLRAFHCGLHAWLGGCVSGRLTHILSYIERKLLVSLSISSS